MGWVRDRKWHGPGVGGETDERGDGESMEESGLENGMGQDVGCETTWDVMVMG